MHIASIRRQCQHVTGLLWLVGPACSPDVSGVFPGMLGIANSCLPAKCAFVRREIPRCRYTLTDGIKFGGHYLAYKGDPYKVHAAFVVRVLPPGETLSTDALSAACRAAAGAKKALLLAHVDDAMDMAVSFTTVTSVDTLK